MKTGFTLVEILIVVVILGILAAVVVPQFTEASSDSEQAALDSNASQIQKQIELYILQHNGRGPHLNHAGNTDAANFANRLTGTTDVYGQITDDGDYGPYLASWPSNPRITDATRAAQVQVDGMATRGLYGWYYSTTYNLFLPGDTDSVVEALEDRGLIQPGGGRGRLGGR
jgi:general secretion pathway protein G